MRKNPFCPILTNPRNISLIRNHIYNLIIGTIYPKSYTHLTFVYNRIVRCCEKFHIIGTGFFYKNLIFHYRSLFVCPKMSSRREYFHAANSLTKIFNGLVTYRCYRYILIKMWCLNSHISVMLNKSTFTNILTVNDVCANRNIHAVNTSVIL